MLPCLAIQQESKDKYIEQFKEVFSIVEKKYVQQPDKQKMLDGAIRGMLKSLDPYSTLFVDEDLEDFKKDFDGEFGGIGVEIYPDKTGLKIISPIDDLPAFKAGIKAGDIIVGVDDYDITSEFYDKAVKRIRGPIGSKVKITIYRAGEKDLLEFELVREIVKIHQVKANLDGDIAYVRIASFNKNTFNSFIYAIEKLKKESKTPIKGMILDLRNNPGGLLDQAIKISSYFLNGGIVVKIKGRKASQNYSFVDEKLQQKSPNMYVVVLINGGSASASEIVAGALQDHKKAIILGTRSFGKGSVQEFIEINKRSAIKLTEAKFYSPNGREIQGDGIVPDIIVEDQEVKYTKQEETIVQKFFNSSKKQRKDSSTLDKKTENSQDGAKSKKETNEAKKDNIDNRSESYLKDYQYSRAFDLLQSLNITNPIQQK
jgi:carboxyl-terminal processing protease